MASEAHTEEAAGLVFHPMDQFKITPLFGGDTVNWYTPTNATLWMGIAVVVIFLLMVVGSRGRAMIPSRIQSIGELAYGFIHKMVEDVAGKDAAPFFPYIRTLFMSSSSRTSSACCR